MQVARKIVDALLQQIEAERRGNAVDRRLLADVLRMLDALGLYTEAFEQPFHDRTELFYAAEGASGLSSMEVPEYLIHAEVRCLLTCGLEQACPGALCRCALWQGQAAGCTAWHQTLKYRQLCACRVDKGEVQNRVCTA